jgi:hypothetical protein
MSQIGGGNNPWSFKGLEVVATFDQRVDLQASDFVFI